MNNKSILLHKLILFFALFLPANNSQAFPIVEFCQQHNVGGQPKFNDNIYFSVHLTNGDILTCNILACIKNIHELNEIVGSNVAPSQALIQAKASQTADSLPFVPFIIARYLDEDLLIYEDEIIKIKASTFEPNHFKWQEHSTFLMPTANPIMNNHFIGNYEIFLITGGVGIANFLSVTGARSFIPLTPADKQISLLNVKMSLPKISLQPMTNSNLAFAVGLNYAQINADNKLWHIFGTATYNVLSSSPANVSVGAFYKLGYQEFPSTAVLFERQFIFDYQDGAFGLYFGLEKHFNTRKDVSLLLEV